MIKKMKGTEDLLPAVSYKWQYVEDTIRAIFDTYQVKEIRTPIFESKELFSRSVGDTTDIVSKEMYDFKDKGDRDIALRPEGTAAVVRAYVEHKLFGPEHAQPLKVYYMGPMFRYERPQAGRQRQFHQVGLEIFGSHNPATDVEGIALAWDILKELGIQGVTLYINSLGKAEDRLNYRQALIDYFSPLADQLSEDSKRRLNDNPLRILDSKDPNDKALAKDAPLILDYLSPASKAHFDQVKTMLDALDIPYTVDPTIVRGLDYYQDTIFEIVATDDQIGAQATVIGGGRYDGLVQQLGGPATPGFGFGLGMERLLLLLDQADQPVPDPEPLDLYVLTMSDVVNVAALQIVQAARAAGYLADRDYLGRSLKSQLKTADKLGAILTVTLGEDELASGQYTLKNKHLEKQVTVTLDDLLDDFEGIYRKLTTDTSAIDKYFKGE